MNDINLQRLFVACNKEYINTYDAKKPYRAPNKVVYKCEDSSDKGVIEVRVFTALGALPVKDAIVTVYTYERESIESDFKKVTTNVNGIAPPIELPVTYEIENPSVSPEYYFTHYNLRIEALGYYSIHIVNIHVFPETKILFNVNLTPVARGRAGINLEERVDIPNPDIDISN